MDLFGIVVIFALGLLVGAALGWLLYHARSRALDEKSTARIMRHTEHTEKQLAETSRERIDAMLQPFRVQIETLSRDVRESSSSQSNLKGQIEQMGKTYRQVSQQAENLTRALKGEPQTRGKWGEMQLSRALESSGLREGEEYQLQANYTDRQSGERHRPDAVVSLPGGRAVFIDAKTSLVDYDRYTNSEQPEEKQEALRGFLQSMKLRVKELGDKDYARLGETKNLDFVLMFVPIESAFLLALENDKSLTTYALERKIMMVSPSTLLLALQTIYQAWRTERQNKHAEDIAREGGLLYDKVASFVEDMEKHGQQLGTAQTSYDSAMKKLSSGRGNILDRTNKLKELGVKSTKTLKHKTSDEE